MNFMELLTHLLSGIAGAITYWIVSKLLRRTTKHQRTMIEVEKLKEEVRLIESKLEEHRPKCEDNPCGPWETELWHMGKVAYRFRELYEYLGVERNTAKAASHLKKVKK